MKREFSLQCALKARSSAGKGNLAGPFPSPRLSINLFAFLDRPDTDQWAGRRGATVHRCAVYFSPGRASLTRRLSIGAASFLVCPDFCLFGFCCARCVVKIILGIPFPLPATG
ncbi:uncharacterized protein NPIL_347081 [Nephila pilipes]|uniref:Uncharacterized protein n=1 Tax=Nephila pilipes TaxID=299642 RepID=A0A8X6P4Q5_NEPPI|nr:uncharacterized protein NPIL_347081 [Nephila pilipes]